MQRLSALTLVLASLAGLSYACSSSLNADFGPNGGTPSGKNDADAGGVNARPEDGSGAGPLGNAVILVHAAKSPSFRLCFKNELDRRPQPDSDVMPEANVVGVEVGSAVRLAPLRGSPGEIFLFHEALIRGLYPQFGGVGAGPTCETLLAAPNNTYAAVSLGTIDADFRTGVHVLAVRGCPADGPIHTYSTKECGADWESSKGNLAVTALELRGAIRPSPSILPAQVIHLSQPLESAREGRDIVIEYGDLTVPDAGLQNVVSNPQLFGSTEPNRPTELPYPLEDAGVFASTGFRLSLRESKGSASVVLLEQSLARIQALSSPRAVPPDYYAAASNYAFLLLGDPSPKLDDGGVDADERRNLHFLAVPVIAPKVDADAGADAASP